MYSQFRLQSYLKKIMFEKLFTEYLWITGYIQVRASKCGSILVNEEKFVQFVVNLLLTNVVEVCKFTYEYLIS